MPSLAAYLAEEFAHRASADWSVEPEVDLFPESLEDKLGFNARVDLRLTPRSGSGRPFVEFVESELSYRHGRQRSSRCR